MDFFVNTGISGPSAENDFPNNFFASSDVDIDAIATQFVTQSCSVPFDVKTVLPNWIVEEHDLGNTNLVKFFQHYYDWIYCNEKSGLYTNNIESLQDLDNIKPLTVSAFNNSFIPQLTEINGLTLESEVTKGFLKNYKRDIVNRKGTPEGTALFFAKLFPEVRSVKVEQEPLQETITLFVNSVVRDLVVYETAYNALMKPVGIKTVINSPVTFDGSETSFTQEDNSISERLAGNTGFDGATAVAFEVPLIGNYYVYNMGDTGTILYSSGCSGSAHSRAIAGNTSDMPTHTHPNSIIGPRGASFGNINIYEFIYMPYTTANQGITPC